VGGLLGPLTACPGQEEVRLMETSGGLLKRQEGLPCSLDSGTSDTECPGGPP
jgi:hypothetical protein